MKPQPASSLLGNAAATLVRLFLDWFKAECFVDSAGQE